jgi:1,4-dihydroxy-2-naphthoyl-CoA hydrolase
VPSSGALFVDIQIPTSIEEWNAAGQDYLPGLLGLTFLKVEPDEVVAILDVRRALAAWNGYLHAGTVTSMADTCCGYGTVRNLPKGASGFTTVELKANLIGTAREGKIICTARPIHRGRTTQVWDAEVRREGADNAIAHFRNTQLVLWPK